MGKNTFVKAAAQGGNDSSGGGPPGAWEKISSGVLSISNNQSVDESVGFPPSTGVYMVLATQVDANGAAQVVPGNVLTAPPTTTVYYALITWAGGVILRFRGGSAINPTTINWAIYQVIP